MQFSETATSYVYGSGTFRSYSFKTTMLVSGTITSSTSQFTLAIAQSSISATTSTLTYGATSRPQSITINITKSTAKDVRGAQYLILSANRMTYKYCIDSYYTTVNNYFTSLNAGTYNSTTALTKTASRSSLYSTITEI